MPGQGFAGNETGRVGNRLYLSQTRTPKHQIKPQPIQFTVSEVLKRENTSVHK